MRHVSLYRKWRPRTFGAVAGQEPVVRTLRRAIETGRVAHAYLFSGPRGTGKTSTAKVLAMGLNCEKGPTAEPDGTCESCRAIVNNSSLDVLEMDAASNRGIDEIRDLRDKVNLAPAAARTKVYIIDEVHMLTTEAFNALLKMLEEPPEHVVFVLATTEKHKVPATIVSRCQSFDFRRPSVTLLSEKLREISAAEGIEAEPEALTILAREGRGSFRDAEGLLDQLASFADGPVTALKVRELLGSVGADTLLEATDALHERRSADALRLLDRLSNEGKDLSQFAAELVAHLRRLMLLPDAPEVALAEVGAEERAGLEEQAGRVGVAEAVRMISSLGDVLSRVRRGGDAKLELELTFLKLARDYEEPSVERLFERLEALEKAVANGAVAAPEENRPAVKEPVPAGERAPSETRDEGGEGEEAVIEAEDAPARLDAKDEVVPETRAGARLDWPAVVRELKRRRPAIAAVYEEAVVDGLEDGTLRLSFPEDLAIYAKLAGEAKRVESLHEILEAQLGFRPRLEFGAGSGPAGQYTQDMPSSIGPPQPPENMTSPGPEPGSVAGQGPAVPSEPEARSEAPREEAADTGPAPGSLAAGGDGADGTIGSPREALEMARDLFGGPDRRGPGGNQNGGV